MVQRNLANWQRLWILTLVILTLATGMVAAKDQVDISRLQYTPLTSWPVAMPQTGDREVSILGEAVVSQDQMVSYIRSINPRPNINCSLEELVAAYYAEGELEGIRRDVALCQALKETGFFRYGNDVSPKQNNFCGLGATGNKVPGYSFVTPQRGVRAHIQHLVAYASMDMPKEALVDPRFEILVKQYPQYHGTAVVWSDLNGRWAVPGKNYGQEIIQLWREAQKVEYQDAALEMARVRVRKNPQDVALIARVAELAQKENLFEEALRSYDMILRLEKNNVSAMNSRAKIFVAWDKDYMALSEFDKALAVSPYNKVALLGKADVLQRDGEFKGALGCYDQLLRASADDALALYNRGCLLALTGKARKGYQDLLRAQELLPEQGEINWALRAFESK